MTTALPLVIAPKPTPPVALAHLEVTVPGPPQGARRIRAFVRGKHAAVHPDDKHVRAEAELRVAIAAAWNGRPALDCPVVLEVLAYHARPQRLRRRADRGTGEALFTGKPDADNVAKLVMDAITKAGVWRDDTRVADLLVRRRYIALDHDGNDLGVERVVIRVWTA
jgi:Holliday junction resolvase RusA-like endonuclease